LRFSLRACLLLPFAFVCMHAEKLKVLHFF
jgi:hypothetical protein